MPQRSVPTAEQLKRAALDGDLLTAIALAFSDIYVLQALLNAGQAVICLREQAEVVRGHTDPTSVAILIAHLKAEATLDRCAEAAHLVLKSMWEREQKRTMARYN
jgi:hypothetical protein